jgi:hypothetical protein
MLVITVGGTLAANIATVILVGGAIALAHLFKAGQTESAAILGGLGGVGLGLFFVLIGFVWRRVGVALEKTELPGPAFLRWSLGWPMILIGGVAVLWSAMILIGLAAGVK